MKGAGGTGTDTGLALVPAGGHLRSSGSREREQTREGHFCSQGDISAGDRREGGPWHGNGHGTETSARRGTVQLEIGVKGRGAPRARSWGWHLCPQGTPQSERKRRQFTKGSIKSYAHEEGAKFRSFTASLDGKPGGTEKGAR